MKTQIPCPQRDLALLLAPMLKKRTFYGSSTCTEEKRETLCWWRNEQILRRRLMSLRMKGFQVRVGLLRQSRTCILCRSSAKYSYKIKEFRRHGEAASVDLLAVEPEQIRVAAILQQYKPQDFLHCLVFQCTSRPCTWHGLATQSLSGKNQNKSLITCNADGSEKLPFVTLAS